MPKPTYGPKFQAQKDALAVPGKIGPPQGAYDFEGGEMKPFTPEEAAKMVYPDGESYNPNWCVQETWDSPPWPRRRQCFFKPGHGPHGLYCKHHAEKFREGR